MEAPDPKKKAPPAKGAKEEPPPPPAGPPPDAPGWETLSELLSDLKFKARAYDEWRASVKVCNALGKATHEPPAALPNADGGDEPAVPDTSAPPTSDSMAYYTTLLAGVEPERLNVPVIMHALLEQVWHQNDNAFLILDVIFHRLDAVFPHPDQMEPYICKK